MCIRDRSQCVPFVPGGTREMKLDAGGNVFETAVQARFTQDEDLSLIHI